MINQTDMSGKLAVDSKGLDELRRAAKDNSPEALKASAKQFEGLFLNMVMKSMRQAGGQEGGAFDNEQTKMYTSMLDQQLSQTLASRGIGLADVLVRQLSNSGMNAGANASKDAAAAGMPKNDAISRYLEGRKAMPPDFSGMATDPAATAATGKGGSKAAHVQDFQNRLAAHANEASAATGIPAKFMLGQAALESGWGKREIRGPDGKQTHNLFGIKAGANWQGKTVRVATTEYINGVPHRKMEKFRAYDSYADCFKDYANLLKNNPRYENVLANAQDAASFARGLQKAGYATDPRYADKLTNIIKNSLSA